MEEIRGNLKKANAIIMKYSQISTTGT